ncbi:hypothetical protein [Paenibacillus tundrae]
MSDKVIEVAGKTATTGGSALIGGGTGAALGTLILPGAGTAIGYLIGLGAGTASGLKISKKWFR